MTYRILFYAVVVIHFVLLIANILAFIILPFVEPWYISIPINTFLFFFVTNPVKCKVTELENYLRQKLGMKRIGGFVSFYIVKPIKRLCLCSIEAITTVS